MTPQEIRIALILKGVTQRDIARRLKVTDGAVSQVIYGDAISARIQDAIAEIIGQQVEQIWPRRSA